MFRISTILLYDKPIIKKPYATMCLDEIYDYLSYEARVTISQDDMVYFVEDIAVIEFFWYLNKWYNACNSGKVEEFVYSTIEHVEPILRFSKSTEETWRVCSIWGRQPPLTVDNNSLLGQVEQLLASLKLAIEPI